MLIPAPRDQSPRPIDALKTASEKLGSEFAERFRPPIGVDSRSCRQPIVAATLDSVDNDEIAGRAIAP